MAEQIISFKYDGPSEALKKHEIDVRVLAKALDSFADLIVAADEAINKESSSAQVLVKANSDSQAAFVAGSFGVELLVNVGPEVLKALGFIAGALAGSALSVLRDINSNKLATIEIDESDPLAQIVLTNGEVVETSKDVARLIESKDVRNKIAKLIHEPLSGEGISSFQVFEGSLSDDTAQPLFKVDGDEKESFRKPGKILVTTKSEIETVATIEFLAANKQSGKSGWRMKYLGYDDVAVKVADEVFLEKIKNTSGAPKIFAEKFSVNLKSTVTKKHDETIGENFTITKVIGPKRG